MKELEDETAQEGFRQRASRLAKWRELAEDAAVEHRAKFKLPQSIEILGLHSLYVSYIILHLLYTCFHICSLCSHFFPLFTSVCFQFHFAGGLAENVTMNMNE